MDIRKYIKEYTTQLVKEMSGTGTGAGFAPGVSNPQIATAKAFKKIKKEDAPQLAGGKVKNNYAVSHFGFTNAPSVPNRKSKAMDYKQLWKEYKINKPGPKNYIAAKLIPNTLEKFEELMRTDDKFYNEVYDVIFWSGDETNEEYNIWDSGNEGRWRYIQGALD